MSGIWFYNYGGVWHWSREGPNVVTVPREEKTSKYPVSHVEGCDSLRAVGYWQYVECTCGMKGKTFTSIAIMPEHREYENLSSACGQIDIRINDSKPDGEEYWKPQMFSDPEHPRAPDTTTTQERNFRDEPAMQGLLSWELPTGPNCSRCLKKYDKENAPQ